MSNEIKDFKLSSSADGLMYRGVLETAEPVIAGNFTDDKGVLTPYNGGIKLNFSTIVDKISVIAGVSVSSKFKQNFSIKEEVEDLKIVERLQYWQLKEGKTLLLQLASPKNNAPKLVKELI